MSELPAPRVARVETSPRLESRPSRGEVLTALRNTLDGVPGGQPGYREEMAPLWDRLKRGDALNPQKRRDAIGYHITMQGIKNITGREPGPGETSWPDNLATDEFTNIYKDESGDVVGKQREGLRIKHIDEWLDRKIKEAKAAGRSTAVLELSKATLEGSSAPYSELHKEGLTIEQRKRQEAGALRHANQETDEFGRQILDSQIPQDNETNRAAHEREDWSYAEAELDGPNGEQGGALELVVPPPPAPEVPQLTNVPTLRVDENLPTKRVEVPGSDGLPPIYVSGESRDRAGQAIDMGGGEIVVPPTEVVRTGMDVSPRSIPENLQGQGEPEHAPSYPAEGTSSEGPGGESRSEVGPPRSSSEGPPPYNASTAEGSGANAGFGVGDLPPGPKTGEYDGSVPQPTRAEGSVRSEPTGSGAGIDESDPNFRFGLPPRKEGEDGAEAGFETAEAEATGKRADRLARLSAAKTLWWDRTKNYIASRIPSIDLPKIPRPPRPGSRTRLAAAAIGLAALAMVVIDNCSGQQGKPGAAGMPEQPDKPQIGVMIDRPGVPTPWPAEEVAAVIAPEQNQPAAPAAEVKPAGGFEGGKGKGVATTEQDFSYAGEKQSLRGVTKDQLAQLLNPEYKAYVDKMKTEGKTVDPNEGWSKGTLDAFKAKLVEQFGEQEGQTKYDRILNDLTEQERYVVENYNGPGGSKVGIGADQDAIVFAGADKKLQLLDMNKEGAVTVIMGIKGGYSSPGDENFLTQYQTNFKPGGE